MSDVVELTIPVRSDLLVLARLTAAALASRADFGIEDIEDLRLVVEELCLSVVGNETNGTIHLQYTRDDGLITVGCSLSREGGSDGRADGPADGPADGEANAMSLRIIEALVDEYGENMVADRRQAWIRKRRSKVAS
jgi:anti-sigma regulatory factor (Ser/Thr protein kinase)